MEKRIFKSSLFISGVFLLIITFILVLLEIYGYYHFYEKYTISRFFLSASSKLIFAVLGILFMNFKTIVDDNGIIKKVLFWKCEYLFSDIEKILIKDHFPTPRIKIYLKGKRFSRHIYPSPWDEFVKLMESKIRESRLKIEVMNKSW